MPGDLSVSVGGLALKNPVLVASGTFGYGLEFEQYFSIHRLGGICTKGLSLQPRDGNPPPRVCETSAGMLNAIGLANVGVDAFCAQKLPALRECGATVIVNIFGTTVEEFSAITNRLDGEPGIAGLEVNISCPNVDKGGAAFGVDPRSAFAVTSAVRGRTRLPVWVKLSPEAFPITDVARACVDAGADALCAINTLRGMAIDVDSWRPKLKNVTGGLSGPAIKPIAVRVVWEVSRTVKVPVVGIGGIASAWDVVEFMLAGATAVQVGTANFRDPLAAIGVIEGLETYCCDRGIDARDLIGKAQL